MKVKTDFAPHDYLTAGKEYDVRGFESDSFFIDTDEGFEIYCHMAGCAHLSGGCWIVVDDANAPAVQS